MTKHLTSHIYIQGRDRTQNSKKKVIDIFSDEKYKTCVCIDPECALGFCGFNDASVALCSNIYTQIAQLVPTKEYVPVRRNVTDNSVGKLCSDSGERPSGTDSKNDFLQAIEILLEKGRSNK